VSEATLGLTQRLGQWLGRLGTPEGDLLPVRLGATRLSATGAAPTRVQGFDQPLLWVTVALMLWGLVMVYSASIAMPENPRFARYTHGYFLLPMPCGWCWPLWRPCWRTRYR
jgi:cell division protein FtsW